MEAPSELLGGSVSAASGPKVAAKFAALLPGWLVGEGLLRRMRLRAADDPAAPLVLIIETRPAGATNHGADSQSYDGAEVDLAEPAAPPSPPPPLADRLPAVDLLDDSVETAAAAASGVAPMLAPPPPPPPEDEDGHGSSWQVAHTADFSAGEFWVRARGGGHGEVLVVRGFGAAGALPSQQAVPFELEVMEHPLGLAERCRWGTVGRPFPSWNRSILTEISLCHACSCQEALRTETAGQAGEAGSAAQLQWHRRLLGYAAYCGGAGATVAGGGGGGGGGDVVVGSDMRQLLMSGGAGTEPGLGWPELLRRTRLFRHGDEIAEVIARTCAPAVCVCVICALARGCCRRCLTGPSGS
eukprot:COSAG01_NODE_1303_length_10815_cov_14.897938_2_plen_356_part_00